jgi:Flp pilus assembly protein TadD
VKKEKPSSNPDKNPGEFKEGKGRFWIILVFGALVVFLAAGAMISRHRQPFAIAPKHAKPKAGADNFADYAGSESCRECHASQYQIWTNSNHAFAERNIRPELDSVAFEPSRSFKHASQTSSARIQNGRAEIVTLGANSNVEPYQVERVIGRNPLRQFLASAPGGRLQVHEVAYQPASNAWFDVYGSEDRQPSEYGHWTGRGMNWNSQCADCHNTRLVKNYDPATDNYHTTMAEMGVGCEACHGPLKSHVEWRNKYPGSKGSEPNPPVVKRAQTLDACGSCHSRRDELTGDFKPGDSFFDHFSLEILNDSGRWYADGQIKEEDYEFASFLSSRMNQSGVHCQDCHRADSGTGNNLCMRCHIGGAPGFTNAPLINPSEHTHHLLTGKGGECIGCHMPVTVYMQRHPRHDHGFTIPDPLLTKQLGIPNACNRCHEDKTTDWALENTDKWFGAKMNRHTRERAQWIGAALRQDDSSKTNLVKMLTTGGEPPYWRAVAADLLWRWVDEPDVTQALLTGMKDAHPLVREKAVRSTETLVASSDPGLRSQVSVLLNDPVRCVRVAAAWVLRQTLDTNTIAGGNLQTALTLESDQPVGQYKIALLRLARNQPAEALISLQKAVAWDPFSPPFRCTTAVVLNQLGRSEEALETLAEAAKLSPTDPQVPYAQASVLARLGRIDEAKTAALQALKIQEDFEPAKRFLESLRIKAR